MHDYIDLVWSPPPKYPWRIFWMHDLWITLKLLSFRMSQNPLGSECFCTLTGNHWTKTKISHYSTVHISYTFSWITWNFLEKSSHRIEQNVLYTFLHISSLFPGQMPKCERSIYTGNFALSWNFLVNVHAWSRLGMASASARVLHDTPHVIMSSYLKRAEQ